MLVLFATAVVKMTIANPAGLSSLVVTVIASFAPLGALAQSAFERQPSTGEDSSRPTVTLTAQEAYKIELNARKVVAPYCQAKRQGSSSSEAFDLVLSRLQYVPGIPRTTQHTRIFDYLKSEISKCGSIAQVGTAVNAGCVSLSHGQMALIAKGKFVKIWGGDCLMMFNSHR